VAAAPRPCDACYPVGWEDKLASQSRIAEYRLCDVSGRALRLPEPCMAELDAFHIHNKDTGLCTLRASSRTPRAVALWWILSCRTEYRATDEVSGNRSVMTVVLRLALSELTRASRGRSHAFVRLQEGQALPRAQYRPSARMPASTTENAGRWSPQVPPPERCLARRCACSPARGAMASQRHSAGAPSNGSLR
jgi:hypothetical protein